MAMRICGEYALPIAVLIQTGYATHTQEEEARVNAASAA